jgi:hypothetical protein
MNLDTRRKHLESRYSLLFLVQSRDNDLTFGEDQSYCVLFFSMRLSRFQLQLHLIRLHFTLFAFSRQSCLEDGSFDYFYVDLRSPQGHCASGPVLGPVRRSCARHAKDCHSSPFGGVTCPYYPPGFRRPH